MGTTDRGIDDLVLGQFDVAVAGVTLDDAVDLGTLGPAPMEVSGALDFQAALLAASPCIGSASIPAISGGWAWRWRAAGRRDARHGAGPLRRPGRPIATDEVGRKDAPSGSLSLCRPQTGDLLRRRLGCGVTFPGRKGATIPRRDPPGRCRRPRTGGPTRSTSWPTPWMTPPRLLSFVVDRADSPFHRPDRTDPGFLPGNLTHRPAGQPGARP